VNEVWHSLSFINNLHLPSQLVHNHCVNGRLMKQVLPACFLRYNCLEAYHKYSPVATWGALVGLSPSNKNPSPPKLKYEAYINQ